MSNGMTNLTSALNALADSINAKAGTSGAMTIPQMANTVRNIPSGGSIPTITITAEQVVSVEPIQTQLTDEQLQIFANNVLVNINISIQGYEAFGGIYQTNNRDNTFSRFVVNENNTGGVAEGRAFVLIISSNIATLYQQLTSFPPSADATYNVGDVLTITENGVDWQPLPSSTGGHTVTIQNIEPNTDGTVLIRADGTRVVAETAGTYNNVTAIIPNNVTVRFSAGCYTDGMVYTQGPISVSQSAYFPLANITISNISGGGND